MVNGQKGFCITSVFQQFHGFSVLCIMIAIWNENLCCDINFICRPSVTISTRKFCFRDPDTEHRTPYTVPTLTYTLCVFSYCIFYALVEIVEPFRTFCLANGKCVSVFHSVQNAKDAYTIREQNKKRKSHGWTTFDLLQHFGIGKSSKNQLNDTFSFE